MPDKFIRPSLPYAADSLPNNNRYTEIATLGQSPGGDEVDADCNYLLDKLNVVNERIDGVVLGDIPGSTDPANQDKLLSTTGAALAWIKVDEKNLDDNCISTEKLQASSVTEDKLGSGSITAGKIRDGAVTSDAIEDDKISFDKIKNENNVHFQDFFNSQNANTLNGAKILDNSLSGTKIIDNSIPTAKISDGAVTTPKIANGAVTSAKLATTAQLPLGIIMDWAGAGAAPAGWLKANGQSVTTAAYGALFAAIGYTYGGAGANFNVPDLKGRSTFGVDPANGGPVAGPTGGRITATTALGGTTGGEENHTLTLPEIPSHTHSIPFNRTGNGADSVVYSTSNTPTVVTNTSSAGGDLPHNNMPPYMLVQKIIYAGV